MQKVLFVTTEAAPFASTGGMGEICSNLPRALNKTKKTEARVMLPLYEEVAYHFKDRMTFVISSTTNTISSASIFTAITTTPSGSRFYRAPRSNCCRISTLRPTCCSPTTT